jgi:hypothetical protein
MTFHTSIAAGAIALAVGACTPKPSQEARAAASSEAPAPTTSSSAAETAGPAPLPRRGCAQNFTEFDSNTDQRVSLDEFLAQPHAHPDPNAVFHARDGDGDGALTAAEFCSGWQANVAKGDGMEPGAPNPSAGRGPGGRGPGASMGPGAGMRPGGREHGAGMGPDARGPGAGRGPASHMGGPASHCEAHFSRFDANGDGHVTDAEFATRAHPHGDAHSIFSARDLNKDGLLTAQEFCAPWNAPTQSPQP